MRREEPFVRRDSEFGLEIAPLPRTACKINLRDFIEQQMFRRAEPRTALMWASKFKTLAEALPGSASCGELKLFEAVSRRDAGHLRFWSGGVGGGCCGFRIPKNAVRSGEFFV